MQRIVPKSLLASLSIVASAAGHDFAPIGPEFVATSRTTNDQHNPWVSCDDHGNFAIAYSQGDVYVRLLDRDGNPLTDDLLVNASLNAGNQTDSVVSLDPVTGDLVVTMSDTTGSLDGSFESAIGRFFQADGTPYGADQILNVNTVESQFNPVHAFAVDGTVLMVWCDATAATDGSIGIVGRLFDRTGAPTSGEFLINAPNDKTQIRPSVAASRDGLFVCAYVDASGATGEPDEIVYRLLDSSGSLVTGEMAANSQSAGEQELPEVAMDADGDFVIVWQDQNGADGDGFGVFARLFGPDGTPKGPQFVVSQTTAGDQGDPHVAMDYVGNFVVGWESDAGGTNDVFVRRFDRFGTPLSGELLLHSDTASQQEDVRVALSQSGERLIAVWHSGEGNDGDVYARIYDAPAVEFVGTAALEQTVDVDVLAPGMGGHLYFLLPSLLEGPAISVDGQRTLALGVDSTMIGAVLNPESALFSMITGTLDASGAATAHVTLPDNAAFYGLGIRFALLSLVAGYPGGYGLGTDTLAGVEFLSDVRTLQVAGPIRVHPGQTIEGALVEKTAPTPPDEDRATFEALKKQKVKFKVKEITDLPADQVASKLRLEIYDDQGVFVKGLTAKVGKKKKSKLKFKAKNDGAYFFHVKSQDGLLGAYEIKTKAKHKKSSKPSTKVLKIGKSGVKKKKLTAVSGTSLSLQAKAVKGAPPLTTITLRDPDGGAMPLQAYLQTVGDTLLVTDVPLDVTGTHQVEVSGTKGDKYELKLVPAPPDATGVVEIE